MISTQFEIARITIEFTTSFLICIENDHIINSVFVMNANGLPTIPGTSIASIIRRVFATQNGDKKTNKLFGFESSFQRQEVNSFLYIGWAAVHDQNDRPVRPLLETSEIKNDPVLTTLQTSVKREQIRINHQETFQNKAKSNEFLIPAGTRFTFEVSLKNETELEKEQNKETLLEMVSILNDPTTVFIERSYKIGSFYVVSWSSRFFDLTKSHDWKLYKKHPTSLSEESTILQKKNVPISYIKTITETTIT